MVGILAAIFGIMVIIFVLHLGDWNLERLGDILNTFLGWSLAGVIVIGLGFAFYGLGLVGSVMAIGGLFGILSLVCLPGLIRDHVQRRNLQRR